MNIYVGNLPYTTTSDELESLFSQHGQVDSAAVVMDRDTGRSRGFGFVEMPDDAARVAIEALNGAEYSGRRLNINEAKPRR
ncbi:MAG TPA: RNA-binding protein [Acidimicrobiia bacterium]|nr:RNA-binding protein [Acidimicrobiia bacterium]